MVYTWWMKHSLSLCRTPLGSNILARIICKFLVHALNIMNFIIYFYRIRIGPNNSLLFHRDLGRLSDDATIQWSDDDNSAMTRWRWSDGSQAMLYLVINIALSWHRHGAIDRPAYVLYDLWNMVTRYNSSLQISFIYNIYWSDCKINTRKTDSGLYRDKKI